MEEENQGDECVICRKQSGGTLVWIGKMSIVNLEKILKVGPGTLAVSFTSCYHNFHEHCIVQTAIKRSTHEYLFRCPVCRTLGNVFFDKSEKSEGSASFDRILHVAMTMRNYSSFPVL